MRPEYDRAVSTCASLSHFSRCHCSRSGTQVGCRQRGNAASAVAGWAIAVRARGFTVRLGRTMRLSALLPLLGYRQLAWTFISRRCGPSRDRKDGSREPRHSSGHHENRWSEVHPEANLRDGPPIDGSPVPAVIAVMVAKAEPKADERSCVSVAIHGSFRGCRVYDTVVVGHKIARMEIKCRSRLFRQHGAIPSLPIGLQPIEDTSFSRSLRLARSRGSMNNVEQKFVSGDAKVFPVATASGALRSGLVAPKALSRMRCLAANDDRSQVLAVRWISGVRRSAGGS